MDNRKFNDQELIRRKKLDELQQKKLNPYHITKVNRTLNLLDFNNKYKNFDREELHNKKDLENETLAGRVLSIRQTFIEIKDFSSMGQIYINKKEQPEIFELFKNFVDIGDLIEVSGTAMKTMTNVVTLNVNKLVIISKSLKVLPEKYHGLTDEESRARHRYVDLIVNDESMKTFILRSKIIKLIREYMDSLGYIEVETPILQPILGGANAKPFKTFYNALGQNFYLRIAPELPLKKLIVGGFEKVYEIGRIFRNEGMDATHNPEFTSMEAYTAYANMNDTMDLVEAIFKHLVKKLQISNLKYRGFDIDLSKPFRRIHMVDFIKQETKIDFWNITDFNQASKLAKENNIELQKHEQTIGHIINAFYEKFCEDKCIEPTFVYGHPIEVSPLAKPDYKDKRFTERFELFIGQKEFANAFSELNDPIDQFNRFENQIKEKELGNDEAVEMDIDFIEALEYGLPPTGGLGIGIDRLVMLFSQNDTIRNVLLFPQMKDEK